MAEVLLGLGVLVFLSLLFTAFFKKTLIPDVLMLMLLGIVLGPYLLGLVKPADFGKIGGVVSAIALVIILFESGTTLDLEVLKKVLKATSSLAGLTFLVTVVVFVAIGRYALGLEWHGSILLGMILASISPAVVIPIGRSIGLREPSMTITILESGLTDVLSIVLFFGFLENPSQVHAGKLTGQILSAFVFACVIGAAGGIAWLFVLNNVRQLKNTAFAVFAWIFIIYGVTDALGFSGAIAAMAFGAALTNHERLPLHNLKVFRQRELGRIEESDTDFYHEVIFLLKTLFFVYLGLSVKFTQPGMLGWALLGVVIIYVFRTLVVRAVMRSSSPGWQESYAQSVMAPKGLAAAVLAAIPAARGIPGGEVIQDFAYFGVLVSIVTTAALIPLQRQPAFGRGVRKFFGLPSDAEPAPASID
jgi:NhaP-type Na+/H+ or K+/H+ antiporter